MKQLISSILILIIFLSGCRPQNTSSLSTNPPAENSISQAQTGANNVDETDSSSILKQEYLQQTMFAISMPIVTEMTIADDNGTIFRHQYQTMQLVMQDPEVADRITLDYLNRIDSIHQDASDFASVAKLQYTDIHSWEEQFYDVFYSPTRIDQCVLSLSSMVSSYTGERPIQLSTAANYNMLTGDVLTLGSILYHEDAKAELVALVVEEAALIAENVQLYDDHADYIADRFDREESFDEDWFFTENGLCFYFSPYEIAPYSSGIIRIEVPYAKLSGVIADEFFPPEEDLLEGEIAIKEFADPDTSNYTQIAEVVLEHSGKRFLLYAEGALRDIRIEIGNPETDNSVLMYNATVFAAATLTPGDAIMLQGDILSNEQPLRISYRSGSQIHTVYPTLSDADGTVILSEG